MVGQRFESMGVVRHPHFIWVGHGALCVNFLVV